MNRRTRLAREIVRRRRREYRPATFTRLVTPNGTPVRVVHATHTRPGGWPGRASYYAPGALVYGVFPPTPELIRELGRWA